MSPRGLGGETAPPFLGEREGQGAGGGRVKVGFIGKRHDWPGGQGFIKG